VLAKLHKSIRGTACGCDDRLMIRFISHQGTPTPKNSMPKIKIFVCHYETLTKGVKNE
jgi:hypothetical protein